jgi:L-malate glycosyltransferase
MIFYVGNFLSSKSIGYLYVKYFSEFGHVTYVSHIPNKILRLFHMVFKLLYNLKKIDVVIIETYSTSAFIYAILISQLSRLFSISYIPVIHGGNIIKILNDRPFFSKLIFRNSKINVSPSKFITNIMRDKKFRIKYVPNFIELEKYSFIERNNCKARLLWVRGFHPIYNPEMAIIVFNKIKKIIPDSKLCMVGAILDKNSFDSCKNKLKKLNLLDFVKFTGELKREEWVELSRDYDIFLNTTSIESFGMSLIEANASGIPIVSTNVGELNLLHKHNIDAVLVENNDHQAMTRGVLKLINDRTFAFKLSRNGRLKAVNYSWENIKQKWEEIIF